MTGTTTDLQLLVTRYVEAAGEKDYDSLAELVTPDISFKGPFATLASSDAFLSALRRMAPIWERNIIRSVFVSGDRACVVYDFVTSTAAGAVLCVEVLSVREGRIAGVELFFDPAEYAPAAATLNR